jgi:penicillin-binding protein 1A
VYTGSKRTFSRKLKEAVIASRIDRKLDKDEILYRYLSTIYLGGGAYGVGAASQSYFRKQVSQLTLSESALLAGILPAPTTFDPRSNPAGAEQRRLRVLDLMRDQGRITQQQYDAARPEKVVAVTAAGPPKGPATVVYPPEQEPTAYPYFIDYLRRYLTAKYGPEKVFRGGLRIQSTLDVDLQRQAEQAVGNTLSGTKPPLDMSLVAVEPPTGFVKALIGGRDFAASQVNLALGKCSKSAVLAELPDGPMCMDGGGTGRQPGSAFKPFTLAKAFEEGMSPSKVYAAPHVYTVPGCVGNQCTIHNVEGEGGGSADLRTATAQSINTVFAQLIRDVGVKDVAELAHRVGLTMVGPNGRDANGQPYGVSLTLGAQEVSPLDMASAYSVFAARGLQARPTPVVKVLDNNGVVLEDNTRPTQKRVLSEVVADNVTDVLRGVITGGTGTAANIGRPAAGKTGTSENFGNAWFCGFTPTLSTAVWMGYADAPRPMHGIKGVGSVYGGTLPAATWHDFMTAALKDVPVTDFNQPAPIEPIADELRRNARGGFDPGDQSVPQNSPLGGPYVVTPDAPHPEPPALAPPTTVFFGPPEESTTTTTIRRRGLFP